MGNDAMTWIPISLRLPPDGREIDAYTDRPGYARRMFRRGRRWFTVRGVEHAAPTHWRPLP